MKTDSFADRLKLLRKECGLSQNQLSRELHISQSVISHWEAGEKIPRLDSLNTLADFFKCSIDYLAGRED